LIPPTFLKLILKKFFDAPAGYLLSAGRADIIKVAQIISMINFYSGRKLGQTRGKPGANPEQTRSKPGGIPEQTWSNPGRKLEHFWN